MPPKTHHTAVAALPPPAVWEPIQGIRRRYDRQIHRWMPHVNLLYPFLPQAHFVTAVPLLTAAAGRAPAFQVTLRTFRSFTHRSGRCTMWLDPEPQDAFVRLQALLHEAGTHIRRDDLVSVMYSAELNSATSSVTQQRTDRHGILDEKSPDFQLLS